MTLAEKIEYLKKHHPEVFAALCMSVPYLIMHPEDVTADELNDYNLWIDTLDEEEAQTLYEHN